LLSGGAAHINCIVEQELPTIPEHLSLSLILSGVHVAQSLVVCVVFEFYCAISPSNSPWKDQLIIASSMWSFNRRINIHTKCTM
jgi:hypothetical protein